MRWLMLLMSLPPTPTRHRVGVWRKLQRMGAVRLRGSAWILPETPETTELFLRSGCEIRVRGCGRRRAEGHPVRCPGRRLRAPRRGLHVRDAGQAVRDQGPARESHCGDRPRG